MRKRLTVYGLLGVGFVVALVSFYCAPLPGISGGLSANDVLSIRRAIRQETLEPILKIDGEVAGMAAVQTGRVGNGLDGSGHFYRLKKTAKGWEIVGRESWMSSLPNKPYPTTLAISLHSSSGG